MSDKPRSIFEGKEEDEAFPFAQGRRPSPAKEGDRISERDVSSVMNFEGESGFGSMRFVEALPGIMVSFNELDVYKRQGCIPSSDSRKTVAGATRPRPSSRCRAGTSPVPAGPRAGRGGHRPQPASGRTLR